MPHREIGADKKVNVEAVKNVLGNIWKIAAGMTIKEVRDRLYVFHFEDNLEKERVRLRQPWSFNRFLLVLENFDSKVQPEEINLQWCLFWFQIHGLPLGLMIEKIGVVLEELIREVEEVDLEGDQMAWGRYLGVRKRI